MKIAPWLALLLVIPLGGMAQETADVSPPVEGEPSTLGTTTDGEARSLERRRQGGFRRQGPGSEEGERPPPPIDQWMGRMKERNPEEMERLRLLREKDPEAFREELRRRIRERPEALESAPHGEARSLEMPPAMAATFARLREAVRAYRESADETEKAAQRAQARESLLQMFEWSDAKRAEEIQRMENALDELRAQLRDHLERRDAMIDEKLERLLHHERGMPEGRRPRWRSGGRDEPAP